ncbi:hypothetical protein LCGC14_1232470 [marine sediment metagenome]|uniref:C1q domain-containing protein n=1 Tax=marine sediment metagenome TaxID=412755 RepID=A0A0F9NQC8_9ZZZZ
MPGFDNDVMHAGVGASIGVFPNTSGSDNSTEFDRDGAAVVSTVFNSADDLGSDAKIDIKVNDGSGAGGGNSYLSYSGPSQKFFQGVDKTDSNIYKLQNSAIATFPSADDIMNSDVDGLVKFPRTSAFFVNPLITRLNVTGDGTLFTIIFDSTQFDQDFNFDGTSTFTAPRSGRYVFTSVFLMEETGNATRIQFNIVTTGINFQHLRIRGSTVYDNSSNVERFQKNQTIFCNMDAGDTAFVTIQGDGLAADTEDIHNARRFISFNGFLNC